MERRPLRNWEHCEPVTETMALLEICATEGVDLMRWFSSGDIRRMENDWKISRAHVFLVPKSRRCSKRMSKVFRLRYEARSSTIRVSKTPLQGSARGVPVSPNSHF